MHILMIGGTRFMGPVVAQKLLGRGHSVTLFHRTPGAQPDGCRHIQGDCGDSAALGQAIETTRPDVIIHMVAYFQSHMDALERALGGRVMKTVVLSSADVYKGYEVLIGLSEAAPVPAPFTEQSPLRDALYPYRGRLSIDLAHDYDKILVERAALQSPVILPVILRLGMVYGENDANRRFRDPIHQMAAGRKIIELPRAMAGLKTCKCYVENIAHGIVLAAEDGRPGQIYNLADEPVYDEQAWLGLLAGQMNWTGEILLTDAPTPGMNTNQPFYMDTAKIRRQLGYRELVPVADALAKTIRWELARGT